MNEMVASIEWCRSSNVRHSSVYARGASASGGIQSTKSCFSVKEAKDGVSSASHPATREGGSSERGRTPRTRALNALTPGSTKKRAASSWLAVLRATRLKKASAVVAMPIRSVSGRRSV